MPKKDIENFNPPPKMLNHIDVNFAIFPYSFSSRDVIQGLRVAVLRLQLCQAEPQALVRWKVWKRPGWWPLKP